MTIVTEFTPWEALIGGSLIGLSAVLLMAFHGRIAGMTAIVGGVLPPFNGDWAWRAAFLAGAIVAPVAMVAFGGEVGFAVPPSIPMLIAGGLIVGVGVTYGSGCTSGHGVCGLARLSPRSAVATAVFMIATFITVYVVRHVLGG